VLEVSHYYRDIPCKKLQLYIFEFVRVMSKVLSVPFFPNTVYYICYALKDHSKNVWNGEVRQGYPQ